MEIHSIILYSLYSETEIRMFIQLELTFNATTPKINTNIRLHKSVGNICHTKISLSVRKNTLFTVSAAPKHSIEKQPQVIFFDISSGYSESNFPFSTQSKPLHLHPSRYFHSFIVNTGTGHTFWCIQTITHSNTHHHSLSSPNKYLTECINTHSYVVT